MMSVPPQNVKVYDRPERKFSPIIMVVVLLIVAIVGFFIYKAMHHGTSNPQPGALLAPVIVRTGTPRSSTEFSSWQVIRRVNTTDRSSRAGSFARL